MIIWINGAFGAGKTTAAYELHRRLADSFVYDPENVGFFLWKNLPRECHMEDFQDMVLWRGLNYQLLRELYETYGGTVIVPMTLVDPRYYDEIVQRLLNDGVPVVHIILYASRRTLLKRLKKRSLGRLRTEAFAIAAIDRCLDFFDCHAEGIRIECDRLTVEETVSRIGTACSLQLLPEKRGKLAREAARFKTTIQHIRF